MGSTLYFDAYDGTGWQLWKYDGSNLSEIKVGTSANPAPLHYLTAVGSTLYFSSSVWIRRGFLNRLRSRFRPADSSAGAGTPPPYRVIPIRRGRRAEPPAILPS